MDGYRGGGDRHMNHDSILVDNREHVIPILT